ncbi:hypothetical protein AB5J62_43875 [Amycolatopsis sp. cg5]|uniref:hypothetical protein n=1 Tax=Amycolatopsis sp. cg5 TaxID=3238802 RepID=UPI003523D5C4
MTEDVEVGSRVIVPFGLHDLEGVVERISGAGVAMRVTVGLEIDGTDERFVTTYPLSAVRLVSAV